MRAPPVSLATIWVAGLGALMGQAARNPAMLTLAIALAVLVSVAASCWRVLALSSWRCRSSTPLLLAVLNVPAARLAGGRAGACCWSHLVTLGRACCPAALGPPAARLLVCDW